MPSDTAPSEGRGQMKGVSSTRSPLSHGPRPGHVPAAAAHARMSQPPTGPSENISWQPEAAGLAKPQLFTWSTGCRGHGDGERDRELFTSDSSDPRAGLSPLNTPPWTCPPQGTILAGLSSSERGVECLLLSGLTPGVEVCTLPHPLLSHGRF